MNTHEQVTPRLKSAETDAVGSTLRSGNAENENSRSNRQWAQEELEILHRCHQLWVGSARKHTRHRRNEHRVDTRDNTHGALMTAPTRVLPKLASPALNLKSVWVLPEIMGELTETHAGPRLYTDWTRMRRE